MKEEEERRGRRRQEDAEKGEEERKEVGEGEVEEEKKVVRYHSISHNQLCNFILQLMPTLIATHSTFIFSTRLVSMTMEAALWSQMSRQKSPTVSGRGPCVAMYSLRRL